MTAFLKPDQPLQLSHRMKLPSHCADFKNQWTSHLCHRSPGISLIKHVQSLTIL